MEYNGWIKYKGHNYWYTHRSAKKGEICLATENPDKYCNGFFTASGKYPDDGLLFVVYNTDNPNPTWE